jgi:RNA-directed DNA polymerase
MLETLERGIKGGKWFSLMDKVWKQENLQSALMQVSRNGGAAGVDGQRCQEYLQSGPERLQRLQQQLQRGDYQPKPVKRVWIPKLGSKELRPLGIPAVEDRVTQTALRNVIEPIFENIFAEHSYGLRKRHCRRQRDKRPRNQRWPNACFTELGLFSLAIARAKASQLQR